MLCQPQRQAYAALHRQRLRATSHLPALARALHFIGGGYQLQVGQHTFTLELWNSLASGGQGTNMALFKARLSVNNFTIAVAAMFSLVDVAELHTRLASATYAGTPLQRAQGDVE